MREHGKRLQLALVAAFALAWTPGTPGHDAQDQASSTASKPQPPPIRLTLDKLVPDAEFVVPGVRHLTAAGDVIWIARQAEGTLTRVNAAKGVLDTPIDLGVEPCHAPVSAFASLWVPACDAGGVTRVDLPAPASGETPARTLKIRTITSAIAGAGPIATGAGSLWMVTDEAGTLVRIDPDAEQVVAEIAVPAGATSIAFGDGAVWLASRPKHTVTRINGFTNVLMERVSVGREPVAVAVGAGSVWTFNGGDGTVSRIDPDKNTVTATIEIGVKASSGAIAVGEGSVWVSAPGAPLVRIDPATNRLAQEFTGPGGGALIIGLKSLWIAATPDAIWRVDPRRVEATRR